MAPTIESEIRARRGLRRYFLREYHAQGLIRVLDVAHADGDFWGDLRKEFTLETYWQLPAVPKRGFPKLDPAEVLSQPGWQENVIDLHMKKSPWPAWTSLLPHIHQPTTVFLTIGRYRDADALALEVLGCAGMHMPLGLAKKMQPVAVPYFLHLAVESGLDVVEAGEITGFGSTRSMGMHLVPPGRTTEIDEPGSKTLPRVATAVFKPCAHE